MIVLKLGGSVITDKDTPETVDDAALAATADVIADVTTARPLVIVHGGGSFGHVHAAEHGVSTTTGTRDYAGAYAIHDAMKRLNAAVLAALHERSIPALPVHPLSIASRDTEGALSFPVGAVRRLIDTGFVPVVHGDVIAHEGAGVTVLSGDEIVTHLGAALSADRVGICSTVPGVFDEDGEVISTISSFEAVESALGASESTDVSGGMAGKVRALLELETPASIFGPHALSAFLAGESPGTLVDRST